MMFTYRDTLVAEQRRRDLLKEAENYRIAAAATMAAGERRAQARAEAQAGWERVEAEAGPASAWAVATRVCQRLLTLLGLRRVAPALPGEPPPV